MLTTMSQEIGKIIKDERSNPMNGFDDVKPMYLDAPPPELVTFRQLSDSEKRQQCADFYKQAFIQDYINHKWEVERHNRDWLLRLVDLRDEVSESDKVRVKQKIIEFCKIIAGYDQPLKALYIDTKKYMVETKELQEVAWDSDYD